MTWDRKGPVRLGGFKTPPGGSEMPRDLAKALQRARRLSPGAALDWAEASLATVGRNMSEHRRHPETGDYLRAALADAVALHAVLQRAVEDLPPETGSPKPSADLGVAALRQG